MKKLVSILISVVVIFTCISKTYSEVSKYDIVDVDSIRRVVDARGKGWEDLKNYTYFKGVHIVFGTDTTVGKVNESDDYKPLILVSKDATTWNKVDLKLEQGIITNVSRVDDKLVASCKIPSTRPQEKYDLYMLTTTDGINWEEKPFNIDNKSYSTENIATIYHENGVYIAPDADKVPNIPACYLYSTDFVNWKYMMAPEFAGGHIPILYDGKNFILGGLSNIFHSADGKNWIGVKMEAPAGLYVGSADLKMDNGKVGGKIWFADKPEGYDIVDTVYKNVTLNDDYTINYSSETFPYMSEKNNIDSVDPPKYITSSINEIHSLGDHKLVLIHGSCIDTAYEKGFSPYTKAVDECKIRVNIKNTYFTYNEKKYDLVMGKKVTGKVIKGETYYPANRILKIMGADPSWFEDCNELAIMKGNDAVYVYFKQGTATLSVDHKRDVALKAYSPMMINGIPYLNVKFFSNLDCKVETDKSGNTTIYKILHDNKPSW